MFDASGIEKVIALSVACMLKQSFDFFLSFLDWGYIKYIENKCGQIQYSLDYPPNSILCLCLSLSFVSLFCLSSVSNLHTPTPGTCKPSTGLDHDKCLPNVGLQLLGLGVRVWSFGQNRFNILKTCNN